MLIRQYMTLLFSNKPVMQQTNYSYPFAGTDKHKEEWNSDPELVKHKPIIVKLSIRVASRRTPESIIVHSDKNSDTK